MGSIFKPKVTLPPPPEIELPDPVEVPKAEDEAREASEAEEMRRRQRKRKGRRSTILTTPEMEDVKADTNQPTLLGY